jgi:2-C-methyl-D-erythritol 4-phosphate cytidylyltransferase
VNGVWAVLAAAGSGERLGGDRPKAFAKLGDRVLLAEPLERLERSDWVDAIVIVAPVGWEEPSILLAEELSAGKVSACVPGGATRAESVRAGVSEVPEEAAVILVHDAARPFLPEDVIERVLTVLGEGWDGAVPGLRVADTIKRTGADDAVVETLDRDGLVAVQTPQAFVASALRRAIEGGTRDATDCAALVEASGGRVRVVEGDHRLVKVTTSSDLELVERLLAGAHE